MADRFLCVCQGGNVRSVALATRLKQKFRRDAIACGVEKNSTETVRMLCEWADVIVVMTADLAVAIPGQFSQKVYVCEVGRDRFHSPTHPELLELVKRHASHLVEQFRHG